MHTLILSVRLSEFSQREHNRVSIARMKMQNVTPEASLVSLSVVSMVSFVLFCLLILPLVLSSHNLPSQKPPTLPPASICLPYQLGFSETLPLPLLTVGIPTHCWGPPPLLEPPDSFPKHMGVDLMAPRGQLQPVTQSRNLVNPTSQEDPQRMCAESSCETAKPSGTFGSVIKKARRHSSGSLASFRSLM